MFVHWFNYDHARDYTFLSWYDSLEGQQLATDGFFYMGNGRKVVCCGCFKEITVDNYSTTRRIHEEARPTCKLFRVIHMISGVPTPLTYGAHGYDQEMAKAWTQYSLRKSYDLRFDTFEEWNHPLITAEEAAMNGFIYSGFGDAIECSYCRVHINQPDTQNLRELHEKLSSHCKFVRNYDTEDTLVFE